MTFCQFELQQVDLEKLDEDWAREALENAKTMGLGPT